jgi:hypothetical protein
MTMLEARGGFAARTISTLFAVTLIYGCSQAPTQQVSGVRPSSGFLPNPSLLQPGEQGQADLVYLNPAVKLSSYNKVMLAPVTFQATPGSDLNDIPPGESQALVNTFHADLYDAISQRCRMVNAPVPDTMLIRLAIVDAKQSDAPVNTVATYVPQARMLDTVTGYAFNDGVGNFVGSATVEGYVTDATKGTLIWQGVDKRAGANAIGGDSLASWGDVKNASKVWSEQFGKRLDELGACRR